MKTLIVLTALLCLNFAPKVQAQVKNNVEKDLASSGIITDDQRRAIVEALDRVKDSAERDKINVIGAPDYQYARSALQVAITKSIARYFSALSEIESDVSTTLTKLEALESQVKSNALMSKLYVNELNRLIPLTHQSINEKYTQAIRGMLLIDSYPLMVTKHKGIDKRRSTSPVNNFGCVTGACVLKIAEDLKEWFEFSLTLNEEINFANFKTSVRPSKQTLSPRLTQSLYEAFRTMMKGPKPNVSYSMANYLANVVKVPAGAILSTTLIPSYVFEKFALLVAKVATLKVERLELSLQPVTTYSYHDVFEAIETNTRTTAERLPAVLYDAQIDEFLKAKAPAGETSQAQSSPIDIVNRFIRGDFSNCSARLGTVKNLIVIDQTQYWYNADDKSFVPDLDAFVNSGICRVKQK